MKINLCDIEIRIAKQKRTIKKVEKEFGEEVNKLWKKSFNLGGYHFPFSESSVVAIVIYNKKIIGVASCFSYKVSFGDKTHPVWSEIKNVCVDKNYSNSGICQQLMVELIECLKIKGVSRVSLLSRNPVAKHIYQKIGFTERCKISEELISYEMILK